MNRLLLPFLGRGLVLGLFLGFSPSLSAQSGRSILELLPAEGRTLLEEGAVEGTLGDADYWTPDGTPYQAWSFSARAGQSVTFDLVSEDFDAYLFLAGPGLTFPQEDEDGGGACHARLTLNAPQDGLFQVIVSRSGFDSSGGRFTLWARRSPPPPLDTPCGRFNEFRELPSDLEARGRRLAVGETVESVLSPLSSGAQDSSGNPLEPWELFLNEGETVTVELRSTDFDAYLHITGPGMSAPLSDDDSAGERNSRLVFQAPQSGTYLLVASTFLSDEQGTYQLSVASGGELPFFEPDGWIEPEEGFALPLDLDPEGRALPLPGRVEGVLDPDGARFVNGYGSVVQAWALNLEEGESVILDLASEEFDAYLYVVGPGLDTPLQDDDGGGMLNSRIAFRAPVRGEFWVVASSLGIQRGAYTLWVARPGR